MSHIEKSFRKKVCPQAGANTANKRNKLLQRRRLSTAAGHFIVLIERNTPLLAAAFVPDPDTFLLRIDPLDHGVAIPDG